MSKVKKALRKSKTTIFATWNLNGRMHEPLRQEELIRDMRGKDICFAALQETGWKIDAEVNGPNGELIINFESTTEGYRGLGFYISPAWKERIVTSKLINNRIAVIRLKAWETEELVIINVYGPTMVRTIDDPETTEEFYNNLKETYMAEKRSTQAVYIIGDFNSKIGTKTGEDGNFMGNYGKGERNENGDILRQFLEETGMYLANTHFRHKHRQIATWHGGRPPRKGKRRKDQLSAGLHNQIDYIVIPRMMIKLFTDVKASSPMTYRTDHSMVVGKVTLKDLYKLPRVRKGEAKEKRNLETLHIPDIQEEFQETVQIRLISAKEDKPEMTNKERYEIIKETLRQTAEETLPREHVRKNGKIRYLDDKTLDKLSRKQLKLTNQIFNTAGKLNVAKKKALRKKRNRIFKSIKQRVNELNEDRLLSLAKELETSKGNRRVYEVARIMSKTKNNTFSLYDEKGNKIHDKGVMAKAITGFYSSFFSREGAEVISPWRGEPRSLDREISPKEVEKAAKKLSNHRALGPDNVDGELIKNGGKYLHEELSIIFNSIFTTHETIEELKEGYLYALNKPGKVKRAENTRPLVFLPAMRKVLSNIVLDRICEKAGEFLSLGQHAYRARRSTTEVVMTAQWLRATSERYAERIHIMGIDLSKAFDCIDRKILMETMEQHEIATEDELRLIQFLISETQLQVKIGNTFGEKFSTIIGTPQGDALSPLLFLIYLEIILRTSNINNHTTGRDLIYAYADDVNFAFSEQGTERTYQHTEQNVYTPIEGCQCAACRAHTLENILPQHFAAYHMTMNATKTTHVELEPGNTTKTSLQTLGNQVSGELECQSRIQSANAAFNAMHRVWLKKYKTSVKIKMRLYNSCVRSRLLYNAGVSAYTRIQLDRIDAAHRRHLRRLLGIYYPERISNQELYKQTESKPISVDITELRWTMLGHTLRLPEETPGNTAIKQYYRRKVEQTDIPRKSTRRGRVLTTIPRLLQLDIQKLGKLIRKDNFAIRELKTGGDLVLLKLKAGNRDNWKKSVTLLVEKEQQLWNDRDNKKKAQRDKVRAAKLRLQTQGQRTMHDYYART